MTDEQENPDETERARQFMKDEWESRAASPRARFYVASHQGWDDEETWEKQAKIDADFLCTGLDPAAMLQWDVLDIGCGTGRFIPYVAPKVASYTGFDICSPFVAESNSRCAGLDNARVFESDGAAFPAPAKDRKYDLIYSTAVFIHCPLEVVGAYMKESSLAIKEGGRFRFQVLGDPDDPSELIDLAALDPAALEKGEQDLAAIQEEHEASGEDHLVEDSNYQGHKFRTRELRDFIKLHMPNAKETHLLRFDPLMINCEVNF